MEEKILSSKKNGMAVLLLTVLAILAFIALFVFATVMFEESGETDAFYAVLMAVGMVGMLFGWIPLVGLKVLKPQEALVLTLFGKYVGTLKGEGFYAVNPFCVAFNPAAITSKIEAG